MGENLALEGRSAVRTPMQWTSGANVGFSRADPNRLGAPAVTGDYGPERVNVADQRRDPGSLLHFVTRLATRYRECPELGWSGVEVLEQPHRAVFAHRCTRDDRSLVALHNLGPAPVDVPLTLAGCDGSVELVDLLGEGRFRTDDGGRAEIALGKYGYRWLRVVRPADRTPA